MSYSDHSTRKPPLSRHPAFVPLIAVWLAALVGGCVAVLPSGLVSTGFAQAPFGVSGLVANQIMLAALSAIAGAAIGWAGARTIYALQHRPDEPVATVVPDPEDADQAETVAEEPAEVPQIFELDELQEQEPQTDAIVPETSEGPVMEPDGITQSMVSEAEPFDDAPFYADISLSELLGAQREEAAEPTEAHENAEPVIEPKAEAELRPDPQPEPARQSMQAVGIAETPQADPVAAPAAPQDERPQHGKAVNLLRRHDTQELAMPQLIERFAVALDDQRRIAERNTHSYSQLAPPADLTIRLRALVDGPHPAE